MEEPVAMLRERVRRAGVGSARVRAGYQTALVLGWLLLATAVVGLMLLLHAAGLGGKTLGPGWTLLLMAAYLLPGTVIQLAVEAGIASDRRRRERRLRRELAAFSPSERAAALAPFLGAPQTALRELAESLAGPPSERGDLVAAEAPAGRGNEAAEGSRFGADIEK